MKIKRRKKDNVKEDKTRKKEETERGRAMKKIKGLIVLMSMEMILLTAMLDGTYVYETTFKQSQMLANELASMGIDGNVAASDNYSTVNNANVTDSQIWVTE